MKKAPLTQEEKDQLEEIKSLAKELAKINMDYKKMVSDFWYGFQKRMGYGDFVLDAMNGVVYEKEPKDMIGNK